MPGQCNGRELRRHGRTQLQRMSKPCVSRSAATSDTTRALHIKALSSGTFCAGMALHLNLNSMLGFGAVELSALKVLRRQDWRKCILHKKSKKGGGQK